MKLLILFPIYILTILVHDCHAAESRYKYLPIDSLGTDFNNKWIGLKFNDYKIFFEFEHKKLNFTPIAMDSLSAANKIMQPIQSNEYSDNEIVVISAFQLADITNDTLYLKAKYQFFDKEKKTNLGRIKTIKNVKIPKNDVDGFYFDPHPWKQWMKFGILLLIGTLGLIAEANF